MTTTAYRPLRPPTNGDFHPEDEDDAHGDLLFWKGLVAALAMVSPVWVLVGLVVGRWLL